MMMTQCNKRSCPNSRYEIEKIESIPLDLIIEILTRLPVKSLARFRCVSKLWDSTASSPNFEESFFTISSSRPKKLLFACLIYGKTFFFSSPNPPLTVNRHMSFPVSCPSGICRPVHGLVCCINQRSLKEGTRVTVPSICNPSTGEYLALPRVRTRRKTVINYLGYDPIENQFKVLCMTNSCNRPAASPSEEHQVLTLGTGKKPSWRMINCDVPHTPNVWTKRKGLYDGVYDGICINGVLYYLARIHGPNGVPDIVCFDIRFEKFSYIKKDQGMMIVDDYGGKLEPTLVNHKGKLAKLQLNIVSGICNGIQLWVLEDVEKHEWSNSIYVVPPRWKDVFELLKLCFVGTSTTSEIVFSYISNRHNSFALFYYNTERNTITEFDIQGMEAFTTCKVYTFLDHVDDLKRIMG